MPTVEGYTATIYSGGLPLDEFQVEYDEDLDEAVCWIAAQAGATFSIQVSIDPHVAKDWKVSLHIDSQKFMLPSNLMLEEYDKRAWTTVLDHDHELGTVKCPLKFSKRSEGSVEGRLMDPKAVGTIVVAVTEGVVGAEASNNSQVKSVVKAGAACEKQSKGSDLGVSLGQGSEFTPAFFSFDDRDEIAKFTFKYRSLEVLQAFDIAPRPRIPAPAPDPGEEQRKERRERLRREVAEAAKAADALSKQLKELDKEDDRDALLVKKEEAARELRAQRSKSVIDIDNPRKRKIEVVDLTLDDD